MDSQGLFEVWSNPPVDTRGRFPVDATIPVDVVSCRPATWDVPQMKRLGSWEKWRQAHQGGQRGPCRPPCGKVSLEGVGTPILDHVTWLPWFLSWITTVSRNGREYLGEVFFCFLQGSRLETHVSKIATARNIMLRLRTSSGVGIANLLERVLLPHWAHSWSRIEPKILDGPILVTSAFAGGTRRVSFQTSWSSACFILVT